MVVDVLSAGYQPERNTITSYLSTVAILSDVASTWDFVYIPRLRSSIQIELLQEKRVPKFTCYDTTPKRHAHMHILCVKEGQGSESWHKQKHMCLSDVILQKKNQKRERQRERDRGRQQKSTTKNLRSFIWSSIIFFKPPLKKLHRLLSKATSKGMAKTWYNTSSVARPHHSRCQRFLGKKKARHGIFTKEKKTLEVQTLKKNGSQLVPVSWKTYKWPKKNVKMDSDLTFSDPASCPQRIWKVVGIILSPPTLAMFQKTSMYSATGTPPQLHSQILAAQCRLFHRWVLDHGQGDGGLWRAPGISSAFGVWKTGKNGWNKETSKHQTASSWQFTHQTTGWVLQDQN